jgi:hypothetical protein
MTMSVPTQSSLPNLNIAGGSEMADRVRDFDWSLSPLGPMQTWPKRCAWRSISASQPIPDVRVVGAEPDQHLQRRVRADAGQASPAALGRPARDSWNDIWSVVGPQADAVMQRGESTWNERVKLVMERKGYLEDTYFTWSYSPIRNETRRGRRIVSAP